MTWVLILTLLGTSGSYVQQNPSIAAVPGFTSRATCLKAANAWLEQARNIGGVTARALCTPQ